jgi:hypothetical protein
VQRRRQPAEPAPTLLNAKLLGGRRPWSAHDPLCRHFILKSSEKCKHLRANKQSQSDACRDVSSNYFISLDRFKKIDDPK